MADCTGIRKKVQWRKKGWFILILFNPNLSNAIPWSSFASWRLSSHLILTEHESNLPLPCLTPGIKEELCERIHPAEGLIMLLLASAGYQHPHSSLWIQHYNNIAADFYKSSMNKKNPLELLKINMIRKSYFLVMSERSQHCRVSLPVWIRATLY